MRIFISSLCIFYKQYKYTEIVKKLYSGISIWQTIIRMYTLFSKNINRRNTHWNWNDNKTGSKSSKYVLGWFGIRCFQLKAIHLILRIIKHSTFSIKVLVSKPFHLIKGLQDIYILLILMHFIAVCKVNILKHKNKNS